MNDVNCPHEEFDANVNVCRMTEPDEKTVTGYLAEIAITCRQCRTAFQFLGPDVGIDPLRPTVSPHRDELRVPLAPNDQWTPSIFPSFIVRGGDN